MSENDHRLSGVATPRRYDLELRPQLDHALFSGAVRIVVDLAESTDRIVLHALDLDIDRVWAGVGGDEVPGTVATLEHERIEVRLDRTIQAGTIDLHLEFRGVLNDQLLGFYRSTFTSGPTDPARDDTARDDTARDDTAGHDTTEHVLAVTQFESTHARRAFPCFDEPSMKAVFSITLVIDRDLFAVSNAAEVRREELDDGQVRIEFADTISMSTYLVAFVVGPLEATDTRIVDGMAGPIPLRIVHPPGKAHLCEFALDVAEAALRFFESYYEVPYPGDKVDLIAVPDFAFGAMENLGCITFREVLLLVDPASSTQPELQRVADVINHELAHMWFGDLVTMKWWNGIWLNEAFATFMEVMASDSFRPEWDVWTGFGLARAAAFDTDALHSTRPIEYEVVTAADAEGMFDILTYEKGASVVRMLEQYLGAETFRSGIAAYLRRHAFGCTETTDLWDSLEAVSGEPVRRIMDEWIFRGGHPVVSVELTEDRLVLTQQRFTYSPDDEPGTEASDDPATAGADAPGGGSRPGSDGGSDAPWPVPLVLGLRSAAETGTAGETGGARGEQRLLLEDHFELATGDVVSIQPNVGANGFFRTRLSDELALALAADPDTTALERFVLLDDMWAAHIAGLANTESVVALIRVLAAGETDPSVWKRLAGVLRGMRRLGGSHSADAVAQLTAEVCGPAFDIADRSLDTSLDTSAAVGTEVGASGPGSPDRARIEEVRGVLFALLGELARRDDIEARARSVFAGPSSGGGEKDASLRAAAIDVVASSASTDEHGELQRRWTNAATPQEELRYLNALVLTSDPDLFDAALALTLNDVRSQNAPYLLRRALEHVDHGERAWQFVADNWESLSVRFPSNSLPRMLEGIRVLTDADTARSVDEFLDGHPAISESRQVTQHRERMWVTVRAAARTRANGLPRGRGSAAGA